MALKRKKRNYHSDLLYAFDCFGHPNIRARHSKTIEFTKDDNITIKADCIIGVSANFEKSELKKFKGKILLMVERDNYVDEFHAIVNPDFNDDREVVLRKGNYISQRTFATMLNKSSDALKRTIAWEMRKRNSKLRVTIFQKPVIILPDE